MGLPDNYLETHWEVSAWIPDEDEPYLDFFPTRREADADAERLLKTGRHTDITINNPTR
jgi:hypothetical protein